MASRRIGLALPVLAALVAVFAGALAPHDLAGQFRYGSPPENLGADDWTAWLVGEWSGTVQAGDQSIPFRQTFELTPDRRYLLTHLERGSGPSVYRGVGLFSYYAATADAYGVWFGSDHDSNDGWGRREGDSMVWSIHRLGSRVRRVRTRTGPNSYVVENEVVAPDGSVSRSREIMRRVGR